MKSCEEKLALIQATYQFVMDHTVTLNEPIGLSLYSVGCDATYLIGAILTDGLVQWTSRNSLYGLFQEQLPSSDPLWQYVQRIPE